MNFGRMSSKKSRASSTEKPLPLEEQKAKIDEVRKLLGPLNDKLPTFCSDASISRYLLARNWNTKKASKMLKDTLKWRLEYKPEKILWMCVGRLKEPHTTDRKISEKQDCGTLEDVAKEAETGKVYRSSYLDKHGRTVLVMRPGFQNSSSSKGQIRYLVYCMENAIFNLGPNQEQMVWLIDFQGWNSSKVSVKVTRETAHVLQGYYPERLGLAILYNPPKIFESFWTIVKPFLEPKTYKKVRFVYSVKMDSQKIMEDLFDSDKLESAFGGRNSVAFDYEEYGDRMKDDDERKLSTSLISDCSVLCLQQSIESALQSSDSLVSDPGSEASDDASSSSSPTSPNSGVVHNSANGKIQHQLICEDRTKVAVAETPEIVQLSEPDEAMQAKC